MSTSGSTSYNLVGDQIVEKAFHVLGKASEGEALTPRMLSDGRSSLNLLIKSWGANEHLWTKTTETLALVAGQAAYSLVPKPMRVLSVRRIATNGISTPLNELARSDYDDTPNKTTSPSTPVSFYYDPQTTTGVLYLWPAPASTIIPQFTIQMTVLRRMDDMLASNDDLDMPQEWLQTVVWNLANDLETEYPVNDARLAVKIERMAAVLFSQLKGWDTEPASVFFQPDLRMEGAWR